MKTPINLASANQIIRFGTLLGIPNGKDKFKIFINSYNPHLYIGDIEVDTRDKGNCDYEFYSCIPLDEQILFGYNEDNLKEELKDVAGVYDIWTGHTEESNWELKVQSIYETMETSEECLTICDIPNLYPVLFCERPYNDYYIKMISRESYRVYHNYDINKITTIGGVFQTELQAFKAILQDVTKEEE